MIRIRGLFLSTLAILACGSAQAARYFNCATDTGCIASATDYAVTSSYAQTRYPLVFAHGLAGFNENSSGNYWYDIPNDLAANGATVYVTKSSSFNSSEIRGEQLLQQVRTIAALTNSKLNLIGHSHGGHSIRYVMGIAPQLMASAATIGSPHFGTPVADTALAADNADPSRSATTQLNTAGDSINYSSNGRPNNGYTQDSRAALMSLSTAGAADFNRRFPAGLPPTTCQCGQGPASYQGIRLYSWTGTTILTNPADQSDAALQSASAAFNGEASDGVVGRCSAHFGIVLRDNYAMNHLDEVNMVGGLVSLYETNPKTIYRLYANRLQRIGL